ncbi:type II toxin-antitoxin system RelE/ParE family toxin [Terrimonas pollutisoli]|uniref:type II toxin-antitoxin system RelE/ParE family toxin n=1 Tax=Terrimonas pollutisoli TaxID=3034147 RepID=UPI0023ED12C2|nr:type II toxin-antitoxin system RelE/ParE family toxin [Terrimonas sp. H1YJ31]
MVTVWSKRAKPDLQKAYEYIAQDSLESAVKVRDELIDISIELSRHPEMFPPDKYKTNNDGNWRAFEKYHYRISYRVMPTEIRVARMRHTSRSPRKY